MKYESAETPDDTDHSDSNNENNAEDKKSKASTKKSSHQDGSTQSMGVDENVDSKSNQRPVRSSCVNCRGRMEVKFFDRLKIFSLCIKFINGSGFPKNNLELQLEAKSFRLVSTQ